MEQTQGKFAAGSGSAGLKGGPAILVIRMSSLGDIILAAPVLRNLRRRWPDARIDLLVKPQFAAAAAGSPFVSNVLVFRGFSNALGAVRRARYDLVLDLHANPRSRLLSFFSGAGTRLRYRKDSLARRLFVGLRIPSPALEKHTLERYLEVLEEAGVPAVYRQPEAGDWLAGAEHAPAPGRSGRLCVLQTAFLGDAVLTLPLLSRIKKVLPGFSVTVLSRPDTAQVFSSSGSADEVLADNKRTAGFFSGEFFRVLSLLRGRRFDIVLVPHRSLRSALLARLSGAPVRVGFHSSAGSFLFTHKVPFSWLMHDLERNLSLALPVSPGRESPRAEGPAGADGKAFPSLPADGGSLARLGVTGDLFIGANPGSAWLTKRWPREYWARLVTDLSRSYRTRIVLVGGPGEAEWNSGIEKAAAPGSVLNLTGRTGLAELMAVIKGLKLFITNDSGPMHIAAAFGVPVAALFGPTTRELGFFPYGRNNIVLEEELPCRPCALHGSKKCPRGHFLCMRLITPDKAAAAARNLLKTAGITEAPAA